MLDSLIELYRRDLSNLTTEINSYQNELALWSTKDSISNSGGNLALHICGNLQHYIGAVLGQTGYIRQRDLEFQRKNVSKTELINEIHATIEAVKATLEKLDTDKLQSSYPIDIIKKEATVEFFLLHLYAHLNYHLGQINYHRRLLDNI